jgi:hypothetical protein
MLTLIIISICECNKKGRYKTPLFRIKEGNWI